MKKATVITLKDDVKIAEDMILEEGDRIKIRPEGKPRTKKVEARLGDVFDINMAQNAAQQGYDEVVSNFEDYEFERGRAEYFIEWLGSGAAGTYQASEIISDFDIPTDPDYVPVEDEWEWDYVEDFFNDIADQMNDAIKVQEVPGYEFAGFAAGFGEGDGSYGISIIVERE